MHYKNGREAKEGDTVVSCGTYKKVGILYNVNQQSTTCNGRLATISENDAYINVGDCLHIDDIAAAEIPNVAENK
jgi:hypothetical protein